MLIIDVGTTLNAGNITVGTLKAGFRPVATVPLPSFGKTTYLPYAQSDGAVKLNLETAITSGKLYMGGTYVMR